VERTDLVPGLLVAAPSLRCPFFNHTVVLLLDHGEQGSFGFVVNRPTEVRFGQVLGEVGIDVGSGGPPEAPVLIGGPVSPETGWILYDPTTAAAEVEHAFMPVGERLAVSASIEMLRELAAGEGPTRRVLFLGYAGWGEGQLEQEMRDGSWIPVGLDPALIFEVPVEDRWSRSLALLGIDPARVSSRGVASA
jgi:putative transcriptional regulator